MPNVQIKLKRMGLWMRINQKYSHNSSWNEGIETDWTDYISGYSSYKYFLHLTISGLKKIRIQFNNYLEADATG